MTLADRMRHQRDAFAAALCRGLAVAAVGDEVGPELQRAAADVRRVGLQEVGDADAVVCLDGAAVHADGALDAIVALASDGARVILALCPPEPLIDEALARLPRALAIPQHAVEATWLGDGPRETIALTVPRRQLDDALRIVIAAGFDEGALAATAGGVDVAGDALHGVHLRALEAANAELRRANARLASEHLGIQDAAAARMVSALEAAERLASEWQVEAANNDARLQHARLLLQTPRHRAADALHYRLDTIPGARALRVAWRLAGTLLSAWQAQPQPPAPASEAAAPAST
ncbi:MAG: hypothetical protein M3296_11285, partial [Actinomycetota bacterium]|nr:hypothetical protein [Actinomycetota bacterium]